MVTVRKWNKSREPYDRDKVRRTLDRYGLGEDEAQIVLMNVEKKLYDGISTKKILSMIKEEIDSTGYKVKKSDLRRALGSMRSAPDFEIFVQELARSC